MYDVKNLIIFLGFFFRYCKFKFKNLKWLDISLFYRKIVKKLGYKYFEFFSFFLFFLEKNNKCNSYIEDYYY